jgi:ABC-2 type transport system ATP-binding protein
MMTNTSPRTESFSDFAVETWNLTKRYKGGPPKGNPSWTSALARSLIRLARPPRMKTIIDGVSLAVKRGEFFGIVGSNGAGKTTLLKLLSCLLYPDDGGGQVNGYDLLRERTAIRRSVVISKAQGWLGLLWQLTGRENLMFHARLCGIPGKAARERIDHVLKRLDIAHKADNYTWEWSTGETQKFNLAATFIARTPIVILDEPTSHLDPQVAREIREFVKVEMNKANGQTIIMTTHYLEEASLLCDRVAILHGGQIRACDTPSALKSTYVPDRILEVRATNYTEEIGQRLREKCGLQELLETFEDIMTGQVRLRPKWPESSEALDHFCEELKAEGAVITAIHRVTPTLDDVYFYITQEKVK